MQIDAHHSLPSSSCMSCAGLGHARGAKEDNALPKAAQACCKAAQAAGHVCGCQRGQWYRLGAWTGALARRPHAGQVACSGCGACGRSCPAQQDHPAALPAAQEGELILMALLASYWCSYSSSYACELSSSAIGPAVHIQLYSTL